MRRPVGMLVATLVLAGLVPGTAVRAEPDAPGLALPQTIEKLWFRSGGERKEGYLTVSEEGFDFTARKRSFVIPLDRIQFISFGKMKGDVNTDWVLLTVGVTPPYDLVGFRDGAKWGYGGRTAQIFDKLRAILQQLSAAQYRVEPGKRIYEDSDHACAFAIPEDWSVYVESLVVVSDRSPWGTTILSEQPIRKVETRSDGRVEAVDDLELLDRILAGESPGFFVERGHAGRGMSCGGIGAKGRAELLSRVSEDPVFGEDHEALEPPSAAPLAVAGCDGLRITGRGRRADGAEVVLELVAAVQGETLFVLGLRTRAEQLSERRAVFDDAVSTLKFPSRIDAGN